MNTTIVTYARCSTLSQIDATSLPAQRARLEAWAAANGRTIASHHEDAGLSGTSASGRPGLQAAMSEACRLRAPLVVTAFARFARNVRDALDLSERLDAAEAGLISLSEQVDTSTAQGRFCMKLMASLAEMEAETVSERTSAAMRHLRAQGRSLGSRPPFGWDATADGRWAINEHEQAIILALGERRAAGASWAALANWLMATSVQTKMGGQWRGDLVRVIVERAERTASAAA